jgi:hypothetical protein
MSERNTNKTNTTRKLNLNYTTMLFTSETHLTQNLRVPTLPVPLRPLALRVRSGYFC